MRLNTEHLERDGHHPSIVPAPKTQNPGSGQWTSLGVTPKVPGGTSGQRPHVCSEICYSFSAFSHNTKGLNFPYSSMQTLLVHEQRTVKWEGCQAFSWKVGCLYQQRELAPACSVLQMVPPHLSKSQSASIEAPQNTPPTHYLSELTGYTASHLLSPMCSANSILIKHIRHFGGSEPLHLLHSAWNTLPAHLHTYSLRPVSAFLGHPI